MPAPTQSRQGEAIGALPGSTSGRCLDVSNRRDARSGSIGGGPFNEAAAKYAAGATGTAEQPVVRMYFIPKNKPRKGALDIEMVRTSPSPHITRTIHQNALSDADEVVFYDTQLPVPAPGVWQFRVTSGADTGCFILRLEPKRS